MSGIILKKSQLLNLCCCDVSSNLKSASWGEIRTHTKGRNMTCCSRRGYAATTVTPKKETRTAVTTPKKEEVKADEAAVKAPAAATGPLAQ
ncbi:hypothetical protein LINGRAHAP2_LOCUS28627 [Linum grandiflorum]